MKKERYWARSAELLKPMHVWEIGAWSSISMAARAKASTEFCGGVAERARLAAKFLESEVFRRDASERRPFGYENPGCSARGVSQVSQVREVRVLKSLFI